MAFSISFLARCSSLICSLIARCSSRAFLLQLLDRHAPFDLFEPRVEVFFLDTGVLVDLAVPVDLGIGVLDLLDELALIAGLQPREDRVDFAVERAEDELQGVVLLPSVGIAACRGRPVRLHELGSLPGELQPYPGVVESEILGEFVEDVGCRDNINAFVLLNSVFEGLCRRLVVPELTFSLVRLPGYFIGPTLRLLPYLQGISDGLFQGRLRFLSLFLRVLPGFRCEILGLLLGFLKSVLRLPFSEAQRLLSPRPSVFPHSALSCLLCSWASIRARLKDLAWPFDPASAMVCAALRSASASFASTSAFVLRAFSMTSGICLIFSSLASSEV